MTREEAEKEIEKVFVPEYANYIITALTEGVTVSDKAPEQEPCEDKIIEWKKDFKEYVNALSMPRDDYKGIMEYIDELPFTPQQTCEDCISRQATIDGINRYFHDEYYQRTSIQDCRGCLIEDVIRSLPPVHPKPKTGHCKDCNWWKDSDGVYRRGIGAENKCPINRREVLEGNGYCYMYEPQESEKV